MAFQPNKNQFLFSFNHDDDVDSEDSDNEDLIQWQNSCSSMVKVVKEKTLTIKFLRQALATSHVHLKLKELEIKRLQRNVKEKVKVGGASCSNKETSQSYVDPLKLAPDEIWEEIFSKLSSNWDLENCSKACKLFASVLEPSKSQWLFPQIFPLIYYNDLEKQDILNCRRVCKQWNIGVDRHLETIKTVDATTNVSIRDIIRSFFLRKLDMDRICPIAYNFQPSDNPITVDRCVSLGRDECMQNNTVSVSTEMKMHLNSRNPFIGRSVKFTEFSPTPTFYSEAKEFLDSLGCHVSYLEIKPQRPCVLTPELIHFILHAIYKSPNLKKLKLSFADRERTPRLAYLLPSTLEAPFLENLSIANISASGCQSFQDALLSRFSEQLKSVSISPWKFRYLRDYKWLNLQHFSFNTQNSEVSLEHLLAMNAPLLQKLNVSVSHHSNESVDILYQLLHIINHFSCLHSLDVQFGQGFVMSADDLAMLPQELFAPSRLKSLSVWASAYDKPFEYSFLLRFPFIRNLVLCVDENLETIRKRRDCMDIAKYLVRHRMYESNIWDVLPFLDILACRCQTDDKFRVYTRFEYDCGLRPGNNEQEI